jgi:hypothetical protein
MEEKTSIPDADSVEELARFWDTHDSTDFEDEFEEVTEPLFVVHVKQVTWRKDYELRIKFSNGAVKDVDLSAELYGEVFEPLRSPELFRQVKVNEETRTIEWPNGADLAPEFLYEIGREVKQVA